MNHNLREKPRFVNNNKNKKKNNTLKFNAADIQIQTNPNEKRQFLNFDEENGAKQAVCNGGTRSIDSLPETKTVRY